MSGSPEDSALDAMVILRVYDHNKVFKNELIGCCFFRLKLIDKLFGNPAFGTEGYLISEEAMKEAISSNLSHSNQYWESNMDVN